MKHVLDRWRTAIDRNRLHRPALFAAGLALVAGTVGGPAMIQAANNPAAAAPTTVTAPATDKAAADKPGGSKAAAGKPGADKAAAGKPGGSKAAADKPGGSKAGAGAAAEKPASREAASQKPAGTKKAAAQKDEKAKQAKGGTKQAAPQKAAQVRFGYQEQSTYYFCGPAATRIALTARGHAPSQQDLAGSLGTTVNGTNSAHETTRVLNRVNGTDFYRTRSIPGPTATPAQMDRLQADVVRALSHGYPVVANIKGIATDVTGKPHAYEGGHYLTVVGYRDQGRMVRIADPFDPSNGGTYWMSTITLANWVAERGYSA